MPRVRAGDAAPTDGDELRRAFGGDVDARNIVALVEEGTTLTAVDSAGRRGTLPLTAPRARADLLYRIADRYHPILRSRIEELRRKGTRLPAMPARRELGRLGLEVLAIAAVAGFIGHRMTDLRRLALVLAAAAVLALLRLRADLLRASPRQSDLTLVPAPKAGFESLRLGSTTLSLAAARFDVGAWARGRAVLTDGTNRIEVPLGERPGAFLLFAALVEACGSPDDRMVD